MAGCEFNRELEIDKYVENKEIHGERFARQYLKTNMAHYRAKEAGQAVPSWDVYLTDKGLTSTDGEGLLELTEQPLTSHFSARISSDIKLRVPIEMETVRHANALAVSGADTILMPEHISENGGIFVRFVTRYKRDSIDPNKYQGSQIDLGKNMSPEEAKNKMRDMMENSHLTQSLQSNTYKDAYAFGTEKARRGDNESLSNQVRHLPIRETTPQHTPVLTDEKVATQNKVYSRNVLGFVVYDVAKVGRSVVAETVTTAIMTGKYLFERERKKTEKKPEMSIHKGNQRNAKREAKPPEKIDRLNPLLYKRHTEMRGVKNALVIIRQTDVGVGAIPFLISVLVREPPAPIKTVEKSMRRHEKRELRIKNKELRRIVKREVKKDFVKVQPSRPERVEPLRTANERKARVRRGKEKGIKIIATASKMIPSASEKREGREKRWLRRAVERSVRRHKKKELRMKNKELKRIVKREVKKDSVKVQPLRPERAEPLKERKRSIERKGREAVTDFGFGWMMWMILTRKDSETPKNNFKRSHPALQGETLRRQEVTSWILLSIIYYLTAIREQRMQSNPASQNKKRKILLPQHAVIFAYNS